MIAGHVAIKRIATLGRYRYGIGDCSISSGTDIMIYLWIPIW